MPGSERSIWNGGSSGQYCRSQTLFLVTGLYSVTYIKGRNRDVPLRDKYSLLEYPSFHEKSSFREALLPDVKRSGYVVNNAAASATLNNLVIGSASKTSKLAACVQYLCFNSLESLGFPMPPNPKPKKCNYYGTEAVVFR
uniref:OSJNBa0004L19.6 protein n=1 Tax=Oryza sativa subsp. japonica TaxID=39947 RepID=Q7X7F8_ORYSJ|nr:OSJNBa0004L19.6 [Oryza sativa Japonica Group]CAE02166.2 OSJNBa0087H01.15 [Oryza sativa Japonica Group]